MRNNVNRTRRAGWRLQPEPQPSDAVWTEIEILGCPWLASRASAGLGAGPLTPAAPSPAPFFPGAAGGAGCGLFGLHPLGARVAGIWRTWCALPAHRAAPRPSSCRRPLLRCGRYAERYPGLRAPRRPEPAWRGFPTLLAAGMRCPCPAPTALPPLQLRKAPALQGPVSRHPLGRRIPPVAPTRFRQHWV